MATRFAKKLGYLLNLSLTKSLFFILFQSRARAKAASFFGETLVASESDFDGLELGKLCSAFLNWVVAIPTLWCFCIYGRQSEDTVPDLCFAFCGRAARSPGLHEVKYTGLYFCCCPGRNAHGISLSASQSALSFFRNW